MAGRGESVPYMKKLYEKSEIRFAVICILLYVAGSSIADRLSEVISSFIR